ncbi:hypothetical protein IEQ34_024921 [Dendrobium chrysotoxum]|uniref:NADH:quinone oxidoreductase/Mrp antiporter transmembrane domain-containing protein n=1 Tax=Dendrobium chrysotoxum TaxID=161865 RepID=A0AAV7FRQ8_DENCH|nr:hypothetical protein IEQ34_024921 [Dendrobium chrysotoxum]
MYNSPGISIALISITVGIGFKLSPAPFHQWTPYVYEGVRSRARFKKGLRWIPRHPETRKGVASDEMLRGVENQHRSVRRFPNRSTFRTAAESMGRQETTWRTETS